MTTTLQQALSYFQPSNELEYARGVIQLVYDQLGVPELLSNTSLELNNRFANRAGDAIVHKHALYSNDVNHAVTGWKYTGKIRLSTKYFAMASEPEKLETIVHEACHIVEQYNAYKQREQGIFEKRQKNGHGHQWRSLMAKVGYPNASACHFLDTTAFKNFYAWKCPRCGKKGRLTAQMGGRIINGTSIRMCSNCRLLINPSYLTKVSGESLITQ